MNRRSTRNAAWTLLGLWLVSTIVLVGSGAVSNPIGVRGPTSSTDEALMRWDGTGGVTAQNSGWTLSDANLLTAGGNIALGANYLSGDGGNEGVHIGTTGNLGIGSAFNGNTQPNVVSVLGDIASYNGFASGTDYDRGRLYWNSNVLTLATENTGATYPTARNIAITPAGGTLTIDSGGANTYVAMDGPASAGKSLIQWNDVTATNICGLEWNRGGSFSSRLRYDGVLGDLVWYNISSGSEVEKWRLSLNGNMTVGGTFVANSVQLGVSGTTTRSIVSSTYGGGELDAIQFKTFSGTGDDTYSRLLITEAPSGSPGVAHVYTANGTLLAVGGITSSFPCIKNSSTELQVRLADDSTYAPLAAGAITANGNLTATGTLAGSNLTRSTIKSSGVVSTLATNYVSGTGTAGVDNTAQTVKTIALAANSLTQVGDRIRIMVYWKGDTGTAVTGTVTVNGVTVAAKTDSGAATLECSEAWLHYIDATHANIISVSDGSLDTGISNVNVAGFDWAASQDIDIDQNTITNNHIVVYFLAADIFPKGF